MSWPNHPNRDVNKALKAARAAGWSIDKRDGRGHTWAYLWCPAHTHYVNVYSTPKNPTNHAKRIRQAVRKDDCGSEEEDDG